MKNSTTNNDASLVFSKGINETMKRAIRVRLKIILDEEEKGLKNWEERIKHRLNLSRQKQVSREHTKRIQALKIVIHMLTPYSERTEDVPSFVVKKKEPKKIKGLLPASTTANENSSPLPALTADQISILSNLASLLEKKPSKTN